MAMYTCYFILKHKIFCFFKPTFRYVNFFSIDEIDRCQRCYFSHHYFFCHKPCPATEFFNGRTWFVKKKKKKLIGFRERPSRWQAKLYPLGHIVHNHLKEFCLAPDAILRDEIPKLNLPLPEPRTLLFLPHNRQKQRGNPKVP